MDDHELLREYAAHRSERAFTALVEKHLPFVYATALRLVRDSAAAEDVAQSVFIDLARKAWLVRPGTLPGWLYRATQRAAYMAIRTENRRRQRETDAMNLAEQNKDSTATWENLAPLLDAALQQLNRVEQDALLLRYFDGQSMSETGRLLSLSEPAAQKRVSRALEKMRAHFARQGVTASAALLATTLGTQAATPPPPGLAGKITGPSLAGAVGQAGGAGAFYLFLRILFMSTKTKTMLTAATVAVLILFTIAGIWWYTQPASAPVKVALSPTGSKSSIDPKSPTLHPPPSAPIVPPPPKSSQSPQAPSPATPPSVDPQADLKTAFSDMARLIRAGDLMTLMQTYSPPDQWAKMDSAAKQQIQAMDKTKVALDIKTEPMAQAYEALTNQTPTFNIAGDEATYIETRPPLPGGTGPPPQFTLTMIKINGKWFLKEESPLR